MRIIFYREVSLGGDFMTSSFYKVSSICINMRLKCPYDYQRVLTNINYKCFNKFLSKHEIQVYFTNLLCLRGLEWECPVRWGRVNICTFQSVRCSCYSQARKPQNLKLHFFKQICHAVIIMFLQKAYFWVVSLYWYPHPMWLVPDWLSFAGVSVPAFLLEETNFVPSNRKRAEADASCLRYARVLTELARLVWENIKILRFCTFSPLEQWGSSSDNWGLRSQCRIRHWVFWKWYSAWQIMTKSYQKPCTCRPV